MLHVHLFVLSSIFTLGVYSSDFSEVGCFGADFGRSFRGEVSLRGEFGLKMRGDRFSKGIFF